MDSYSTGKRVQVEMAQDDVFFKTWMVAWTSTQKAHRGSLWETRTLPVARHGHED